MKYKIGDKVRIKSIDWFNENKVKGTNYLAGENGRHFTRAMSDWCGKEATIMLITEDIEYGDYYKLDIDNGFYCWDDWMLEDEEIQEQPLNLCEILKDAPGGIELYSTLHGTVLFDAVRIHPNGGNAFPIVVMDNHGDDQYFTKEGKYFDSEECECILFPSKENRDWSTFKLPRWRAEKHSCYYYISAFGEISSATDDVTGFDTEIWKIGNYFKTEEDAKNSKFYKVFHDEEDLSTN
jgi:hypothetical protein